MKQKDLTFKIIRRNNFTKMWLQLFLSLIILKTIQSENHLLLPNNKFLLEFKILELVHTIEQQYDIQTILIKYDGSVKDCGDLDVYLKYFKATIIIENLRRTWFIRNQLNKNLLCIVCLKRLTFDYSIELAPYFETVRSLRETKLVLYMNHNERVNDLTKLEYFFKYCLERKSLNVLGIYKDFPITRRLHAFKAFPKFAMEMKVKNSTELLYPNRVENLMGHDFYTLPDQIIPRTFLIITKEGRLKISGYVGNFINLLAERLNATLKLPFPIKKGDVQFYGKLETLTRNYTIDLPGTLVPVVDANQILYYSHPLEIINVCLMIPAGKKVPLNKIFFYLVNFELTAISIASLYLFTLLLNFKRLITFRKRPKEAENHYVKFSDYILHDVALRGILGQPFNVWIKAGFFTKYIYILLSLTGLYLSLIYSAFLQTFFTRPFKEPQLKTFAALYENNIYTLLSDREVKYFKGANKNFKLLYRKTSFREYDKMKNELNTSYAYPYVNIHWNLLYNYQQNLLKNKLFIFSEDACMFNTYMLSFPLADNSMFREAVQELIMLVRDYGLINHWLDTNFPDDASNSESVIYQNLDVIEPLYGQPLKMEDFELVFTLYMVLMALGIILFIMERLFFRFRRLLSKRRLMLIRRK